MLQHVAGLKNEQACYHIPTIHPCLSIKYKCLPTALTLTPISPCTGVSDGTNLLKPSSGPPLRIECVLLCLLFSFPRSVCTSVLAVSHLGSKMASQTSLLCNPSELPLTPPPCFLTSTCCIDCLHSTFTIHWKRPCLLPPSIQAAVLGSLQCPQHARRCSVHGNK